MKIGPKYKIARRLGAPVFEKTQSPKYSLSLQKRTKTLRPSRSNYGIQLNEKQKVRFTYCISEKQFSKYVKQVIEKNPSSPSDLLFSMLENRLDSVVLRAGFAPTRMAARQMVSHGHILHNGKRVNVPSIQVREGDVVTIRENSKSKPLFQDVDEKMKEVVVPVWLQSNVAKKEVTIKGTPQYGTSNLSQLNLAMVIQFYKR